MKHLALLLSLLLTCLVSYGQAGYVAHNNAVKLLMASLPQPSSGPSAILRWKFDEGAGQTTADSSGNGYTGILTNYDYPLQLPLWTTGPNGNGAINCETNQNPFNGSYTNAAAVQNIGNISQMGGIQHASISAWIYQLNNQDTATVGFVQDGSFNNYFGFAYNQDENLCYLGVGTGGTIGFMTVPTLLTTPAWVHVVMTFDGTQSTAANRVQLYENGVEKTKTADSGSYPTTLATAANLSFFAVGVGAGGNASSGGTPAYAGEYDDVQVFNVTLTQAQVTALYTAGAQ